MSKPIFIAIFLCVFLAGSFCISTAGLELSESETQDLLSFFKDFIKNMKLQNDPSADSNSRFLISGIFKIFSSIMFFPRAFGLFHEGQLEQNLYQQRELLQLPIRPNRSKF